MAAAAKSAAKSVFVYSLLPYDYSALIERRAGERNKAGQHVSFEPVTLRIGDNQIDAEQWAQIKTAPQIKRLLDRGDISEGLITKQPARIREQVWDGVSRDPAGNPQLRAAGTDWIATMSPCAASRTDKGLEEARARGVIIFDGAPEQD